MGRKLLFTEKEKEEIYQDYLSTPPGYTAQNIANRLGVSYATINNIINKRIKEGGNNEKLGKTER